MEVNKFMDFMFYDTNGIIKKYNNSPIGLFMSQDGILYIDFDAVCNCLKITFKDKLFKHLKPDEKYIKMIADYSYTAELRLMSLSLVMALAELSDYPNAKIICEEYYKLYKSNNMSPKIKKIDDILNKWRNINTKG